MITIERMRASTPTALADINALLPQLRRTASEPLGSQADLDAIVGNEHVIFVVAKEGEKIVGMATAYLAQKFGKKTGFVEDVVMDGGYRGQGLGQKVMEALAMESKAAGASQLYLTSGHDRVAAQKLYEKLGFVRKDTNVFKLSL